MPKFIVLTRVTRSVDIVLNVEAENEKEAAIQAEEQALKDSNDEDWASAVTEATQVLTCVEGDAGC